MSSEVNQLALLHAIADVYYSMHHINLEDNTVFEYAARNNIKEIVNHHEDAINTMIKIINLTIRPEMLDEALSFTDLTTIAKRMQGKKLITKELHGKNIGWIEASFITVDTDEDGFPLNLIFVTRSIEEEKQAEERLINRSNTDELTGFFNRRAYEDNINEYNDTATEEDFVYVSMDVNGLKVVNDTLGHAAGDELLQGAAEVMRRCLGPYGRIFRTGGDEFAAIIFASEDDLKAIKNDFRETMYSWSGNLVDSVAIACGFVARRDTEERSVRKIALIAEEKMYAEKTLYYQRKGFDRRGQMEAHSALCKLYTKILKINLTDDSYQIVNMEMAEQTAEMGFSEKISEWLRGFALSGQVHEDDVEAYLKLTDTKNIIEYFEAGKTSLHNFYRRCYDGVYKQVMMEIIPAKDYAPDNQTFYLYVKDIDR